MTVISMVVGATTPSGAVFVTKVTTGPNVRVAVSTSPTMSSPTFFGPVAVDAQKVAKVTATGLMANRQYYWRVEDAGVVDAVVTGKFRTHPTLGSPASFTIALASCAGSAPEYPGTGAELAPNRVSNHPVFDTIRELDPLMFAHLGDVHYYDIGSGVHVPDSTVTTFRRAFDDVLLQSRQHQLYREVPWAYVWDDHDYGPNNSDGSFVDKANAAQAYRERVPHYPLDDASSIYQAFQIGRVQFVMADSRYNRTPNSTMDGKGLLLDGAIGNYVTTPTNVDLTITGDIDLRAEATITNWNAAAPDGVRATLVAKWFTPNRSYFLGVENDGRLSLFWSTTGTNSVLRFSTVPVPVTTGRLAVRATLDADDEDGNHGVRFYTGQSIDGPWTQLGSPVTTAGTTSIFAGTAVASVGASDNGSGRPFAGRIHKAQIRNGIDGPTAASPDFDAEPDGTTSFSDDDFSVWTLQGTSQILAKSMLGTAQKTWLTSLLNASSAEVLVWLMPSQWLAQGSDTWGGFATERQELADLLESTGWADRMCMVYGDQHAAGINSGATNHWGGFPVLEAASMDSGFGDAVIGRFDVLEDHPGRNQYGTLQVIDVGSAIIVRLTAYNGTDKLGSHAFGIALETPAAPPGLVPALSGAHRAVFEARVLTTYQTGDDPDGIEIPILSGDVKYDATANIFADLSLETVGTDGKDSLFPRRGADLLAPYGNEIFVRSGVDLGDQILWVPLGYFRINTIEQSPASNYPIRITGQDRMSGIVDGRLVNPIQFAETRTIGSVVEELVSDIYADAVVVFDDDSDHDQLGRQILVEEDRYAALHDVADSLGKVVYWDGTGVLRIEDNPDPDVIAWEIKAGRNGVMVESSRSVSREGMANAVVATGEGATDSPVRAVVVDNGPHSATRWGGRFGRVPRYYSSPLLTTGAAAAKAAASLLRRYVGSPYNVSFGTVANPALRPRDVVRITQLDANREKHYVETCTVPLVADQAMTGTTREQTLVTLGQIQEA